MITDHTWIRRLAGPAVLFLICAGFFWKLTLTDQYTWLDSPDLAYQVLPWYQFQAGEWHAGRIPLWDPHIYGGQPLIGQAQPGLAYPLNWILFSLPLRDGWIRQSVMHWYFVFIHFMAAVFCYWLCRDLKRSHGSSILAGAVFGLGGYIGVTDWPQMLNGAVWAPLVFLFLLRAFRGERPAASAAAAGAFMGMAWLSGHHQIPLFISLAAAVLWPYQILRSGKPDWRIVRLAVLFGALVALVSGLQTIPAYEYGKLSVRWIGLETPVGWDGRVPYRVHDTFSLIASALPGIVIPGMQRHADPFIGVVAFSLALLAVALFWDNRPVRVFAAVAAGGLLFALGRNSPLHGLVYSLVPLVEKARNPSMAIFIFHFGVAVLAAFGADAISEGRNSAWPRRAAFGLTVFGALALTVLLVLGLAQKAPDDDRFAVIALVALLFALVLTGWRKGCIGNSAALVAATILALVEFSNVSGIYWRNKVEKDRHSFLAGLADNADIVQFLRKLPWPMRIDVPDKDIPFNFGDWHGIDVYGGFQASLPVNLRQSLPHDRRMRQVMGITYTLSRDPAGGNQLELFQGASGIKVLKNLDAFPRVWTVHEAVRLRDRGEIGAILNDESFDLRRKTYLFVEPPAMEKCEGDEDARMVRRTSVGLTIEADMKCAGMVVMSENYFPGWKATVDGKPAKIYEVYGTLRGVMVEGGRHRIEMRYRPVSVYVGALMTASGWLLAGAIAFFAGRRATQRR